MSLLGLIIVKIVIFVVKVIYSIDVDFLQGLLDSFIGCHIDWRK